MSIQSDPQLSPKFLGVRPRDKKGFDALPSRMDAKRLNKWILNSAGGIQHMLIFSMLQPEASLATALADKSKAAQSFWPEGRLATFDRRIAAMLPPDSLLRDALAIIPV